MVKPESAVFEDLLGALVHKDSKEVEDLQGYAVHPVRRAHQVLLASVETLVHLVLLVRRELKAI